MTGRVLVTAATGKTGRALVSLLEAHGTPYRAASRSGEPPFDWMRPETRAAALEGVSAVYLVAPPTVDDPYSKAIAFCEAAKARGVGRIVFLGMASLPAGGPAHGQVHQWLADHAEDWAVLQPSAFMENFSEGSNLASIREEGAIYSSTGEGRVGFISAGDIARAALAALSKPGPLADAFVLTGGETLSYDEVAAQISAASGRRVTHANISMEALVARFIARGLPQNTAWFLAAGYRTIAEGMQDWTTDTVRNLTGRAPTTFRDFAQANAAVWRAA